MRKYQKHVLGYATSPIPDGILKVYYTQLGYSSRKIAAIFYGDWHYYKTVLSLLASYGIPRRKTTGIRKTLENPEYEQKRVRNLRVALHNPEVQAKRIANMVKALHKRPTTPEQKLIDIITKYQLPFRYTGDGSFIIAGLNPDFVNINGLKVAIDVFGDYWHGERANSLTYTEQGRKVRFAEFGWNLVVLWESQIKELSDTEIINHITPKPQKEMEKEVICR